LTLIEYKKLTLRENDLDAEDSEDPLMVSKYVVDIFKYLKQTEV